jgi:hypothetical protein
MPVTLAAHELFLDTFSNTEGLISQEIVTQAVTKLVEPVISKLGDSNLRLHESARKCVLFVAENDELMGFNMIITRLHSRLSSRGKGHEKVFFGVLDTMNFLLLHFPNSTGGDAPIKPCVDVDEEAGDESSPCYRRRRASVQTWTERDVAPFVLAGMDDALGPRVRGSAVALAVNVYQVFGMEAMEPLLESVRPAIKALLKQKFEESEKEGQDGCTSPGRSDRVMKDKTSGGLVVQGSCVKPPPGYTLPPIVGSPTPDFFVDEEELLMDGILEEAGLVFSGGGMGGGGLPVGFRSAPVAGHGLGLDLMDEEQRLLEEELLGMGMDLEGLDEQQALLSSLQQSKDAGRSKMPAEAPCSDLRVTEIKGHDFATGQVFCMQ